MNTVFSQINIVSRDPEASMAFYRRLGVSIEEDSVWRTASGVHHVSAHDLPEGPGGKLAFDSTAFAQFWNGGWTGRADLSGRVVVGFRVASREEVDGLYADMTGAGYRGLQEPCDAIWGARFAVIEDPDGIAVGVQSPASEGMKLPPPDL